MSFLKDVKVSKVSFVRKAANKRNFLLLKADEGITDDQIKNEEYIPMRKEVKDKLITVMKAEENVEKTSAEVADILKADEVLKVSDTEVAEIVDFVDFAKAASGSCDKPAGDKLNNKEVNANEDDKEDMAKTEDLLKEVELLKKSLETANTTINSITKDTQRRDILSFLAKECAFAPGDVNKHADTIMELEKAAPEAAASYKETLKTASVSVEQSKLFKEVGSSTEDLLKAESDGFDLIKKFDASFNELKKSADKNTPSAEAIVSLVKSFGNQYNDYREAHIRRAKLHAI